MSPGIVRIGDTVRRPPTPVSEFTQRLLRHLADRGFAGAPAALGYDAQGRDVFGYIDGDVPADLSMHEDPTLTEAASLIRRYHDVAAELVASPAAAAVGIETICHNDLSPCNFVFRSGIPMAIIDFDAAAPGTRSHDLGYAAWLWLDLGSSDRGVSEQQRRLRVFLNGYGLAGLEPETIVTAALTRQTILIAEAQRIRDECMLRWATECRAWTLRHRSALVRK